MRTLLEPKECTIELPDEKGEKTYLIHKMDAITARRIITQYPSSGLPKIGEYDVNEKLMIELLSFVAVQTTPETLLQLSNPGLIMAHVPDWETLMKLEWAMMEYNCSFFRNGAISTFLDGASEKLPELITSILTPLLEQYSPQTKPPSTS